MKDELTHELIKLCISNLEKTLKVLKRHYEELSIFEKRLLDDLECEIQAWLCEIEKQEEMMSLEKETRYVFSPLEVIIYTGDKLNHD